MDEEQSTVNVNKIVQSLSFEVEAIPQDNVLQLTSTPNSTPLNVKIKVRKKPNAGNMQHAVITLPKYYLPRKKTQNKRVRLVSSDQTIMSFNMFMESDDQMVPPKAGKTFFGRLKSGGCLEPSASDDEYAYAPSTSTFASNKPKIHTIIPDETPENSEAAKFKETVFKSKCKSGGCLDPPFGEDKYPYMPSKPTPLDPIKTTDLETEMLMKGNISVPRDRSPSLISMSPKRSFYTTTEQKPSDLSIYKPEPDKNELGIRYSHSIMTYPPAVTPSEMEIFNSTREKSITSVADKTRKSFGQSSETFFSPKKQSFEETTTSYQEGLLKQTLMDIQVSTDNLNSDTKVSLETKRKKVSISKEKSSISEKLPKTEGTTQVKLEEFLYTSAILRSGTNEIDENTSTLEKQNKKELTTKEHEPLQLKFGTNKPTEVLTNKNLSQDITKSEPNETDLNITNLTKEISEDRSGFSSEKNNPTMTLSDFKEKSRNTSFTLKTDLKGKQLHSRNKSSSKSPKKSLESERKTSKTLSLILQTRETSMDSKKSVRTGKQLATSPSRKLSEASKLTKTETANDQIPKKPPIYPDTAAYIQDNFLLGDDGSKSPLTTSESYNKSYEKGYIEIETENITALITSDDDLKNQARTESFNNREHNITRDNIQDITLLSVTNEPKAFDKRDSKTLINNGANENEDRYSIIKSDIVFDKGRNNSFKVPEVMSKPLDINEEEIETTNQSVPQTTSVLTETSDDKNTAVQSQETSAKDIALISPLLAGVVANNIETQDVIPTTKELNKINTSHDDVSIKSDYKIDFEKIDSIKTTDERIFSRNESTIPIKQKTIISPKDMEDEVSYYKEDLQMRNANLIATKQSSESINQKTTIEFNDDNSSKISYSQEDSRGTELKAPNLPALPLEVDFSSEKIIESQSKEQAKNQSSFTEIYYSDTEIKSDLLTPKIDSKIMRQTEVLEIDTYYANKTSVDETKATISTSSRDEPQGLWRNEGQVNILSIETSELNTTSNSKKQSFDASLLSMVNESIIQSKISPIQIFKYDTQVNDESLESQSHELPVESPTIRIDTNDLVEKIKDNNLSHKENTFELLGDQASSQKKAAELAEATDFNKETDDGSYRHNNDVLQTNLNDLENIFDRYYPNKYSTASEVNVKRISDQEEQSEKYFITDKDSDGGSILNAMTIETLDDTISKMSGTRKGIIKETSLADYAKHDSELTILLNKSSVQEEQSEKVSIVDKGSDKMSILNAITTEQIPKESEFRKEIIIDTSVADYENSIYGNESSTSLNKSTEQPPMASDVKKMDSENVTLDLALQSFLDKNNGRVIKSLDTSSIPDKHSNEIITIRSTIKTDDPGVRIPISSHHGLSIQVNRKSFNDFERAEDLGSTGVTIITEFGKPIEQASMSHRLLPKSGSKILNESLSLIYEHQLVPLQNVIQNLKEEIAELAAQQKLLRERLLGLRRRKSIRFNVRKCSCWMK